MDPGTPRTTDGDLQEAEDGDSPSATPMAVTGGTMSYKSILTKKQYKRRRMYKMAWKALLTMFEDNEDSDGSDDLLDDSDEEDGMASVVPQVQQAIAPKGKPVVEPKVESSDASAEKGKDPIADEEKNLSDSVAYRAEFYQYVRTSNREQKPQFRRSREDKVPIPTVQTTQGSSKSKGSSIFEVTTMYALPKGKEISQMPSSTTEVHAEIGMYITIRSKMVLDALRDIVGYYPQVSFQNDELILHEPFCVLLHYDKEILQHLDEIKEADSKAGPGNDGTLSAKHEHLTYLSDFISQRYSDPVSRELARHQESRPMCTYDWVWLLFKPGTIVYSWSDGALTASVVEYHSKETIHSKDEKIRPPAISNLDELERKPRAEYLKVGLWNLDFDGETIGRRRDYAIIQAFDGEKSIISLPVFPKEYLKHDKKIDGKLSTVEKLVRRGKLFFEMTKRSYMQYDGETLTFPKRTVSLAVSLLGILTHSPRFGVE